MKYLLIALIYSLPLLASPQYSGLIVKFTPTISNTDKDKLHQQLGLKLIYRSNATRRDVLSLPQSNTDLVQLKINCEKYLKSPLVAQCLPQEVPRLPDCIECRLLSTTPPDLEEIATVLDDVSCAPFPGLYEGNFPILESHIYGKQTPFWAQEAIGTPETIEFMHNQQAAPPTPVGIVDGGFTMEALSTARVTQELQDCFNTKPLTECGMNLRVPEKAQSHGASVGQLICGEIPPGNTFNSEIARISAAGESMGIWSFDYMLGLDSNSPEGATVNRDKIPPIVNMSMSFGSGYYEDIDRLAQNTIAVIASSNEFPIPLDPALKSSVPKIIVGSIAPDGTVSDFSSAGPEVTISAPSDHNIQSIGPDGITPTSFSGTSGATPMVTSALSNVLSYLPGMTAPEAQKLLQMCAIKTASTPNGPPSIDGAGSLNSYKMIRVAAKLREGWPANRNQLNQAALYDFSAEAEQLKKQADQLLTDNPSCDDKKKTLKALRQAFFLMPDNRQYRNLLATLYREGGYYAQANFYNYYTDSAQDPSIANENITRQAQYIASNISAENVDQTLQQLSQLLSPPIPLENSIGETIHWAGIMTSSLSTIDPRHAQKIDQILDFLVRQQYPFQANEYIGSRLPSSPTKWALERNNIPLLRHLRANGSDSDVSDAFIRAIYFDEPTTVNSILENELKFDLNSTIDGFDQTIFGAAVLKNNVDLVRRLLPLSPNLDEPMTVGIARDGFEYQLDTPIPLREWLEQQGRKFNQLKRLIRSNK